MQTRINSRSKSCERGTRGRLTEVPSTQMNSNNHIFRNISDAVVVELNVRVENRFRFDSFSFHAFEHSFRALKNERGINTKVYSIGRVIRDLRNKRVRGHQTERSCIRHRRDPQGLLCKPLRYRQSTLSRLRRHLSGKRVRRVEGGTIEVQLE